MPTRTWQEYRAAVAPRLDAFIGEQQLETVNGALHAAFWYFSFVQETLGAKIRGTSREKISNRLYTIIVELSDLIRSAVVTQSMLLLAASALQLRAALELRLNLLYIIRHSDPDKLSGLFWRFMDVERYAHKPKQAPHLTEEERARILKDCSEWFRIPKSGPNAGKPTPILAWHAERDLSLRDISKAVGLIDDYETIYSATSKFVHGSSIVKNLYLHAPGGDLRSIGNPLQCRNMNVLCALHCIHALKEFCEFSEVDYDKLGYEEAGTMLASVSGIPSSGIRSPDRDNCGA